MSDDEFDIVAGEAIAARFAGHEKVVQKLSYVWLARVLRLVDVVGRTDGVGDAEIGAIFRKPEGDGSCLDVEGVFCLRPDDACIEEKVS